MLKGIAFEVKAPGPLLARIEEELSHHSNEREEKLDTISSIARDCYSKRNENLGVAPQPTHSSLIRRHNKRNAGLIELQKQKANELN